MEQLLVDTNDDLKEEIFKHAQPCSNLQTLPFENCVASVLSAAITVVCTAVLWGLHGFCFVCGVIYVHGDIYRCMC